MFGKVLVRLFGIFLILYVSASSATPTGQPGEAQNINGDIHPRTIHDQCAVPFNLIRRQCLGSVSRTTWQDNCDKNPGNCPDNTFCLDGFDNVGRRTVTCLGEKSGGKGKLDPQAGTSDTKITIKRIGNTQVEYSVTIDHDMTEASVAAVFESSDGSFLIAPNNVIVGNIRGKNEKVCSGDKSDPNMARECYPNGTYNFKAGQIIDFTWGMTGIQEGKLVYGIIPAVSP